MIDSKPRRKSIAMGAMAIILAIMFIMIWAWQGRERWEPEATVTFNADLENELMISCEVADTEAERTMGLMHREELDSHKGMLFIFEYPKNASFWMKNTNIPLDIIFIDEQGVVINVEEAMPEPGVADEDLKLYRSGAPAKWVLEVNQGISRDYGIVPGTKVAISIGM